MLLAYVNIQEFNSLPAGVRHLYFYFKCDQVKGLFREYNAVII